MKKITILFACLVVFSSCSKSSDNDDTTTKTLYPIKVAETQTDGNIKTTTYEYDNQNRVIKSIEIENDNDEVTTNHFVYSNDKLVEYNSWEQSTGIADHFVWKNIYTYTGGKLSLIETYEGTYAKPTNTDSLFYNGGNNPNLYIGDDGCEENILTYDANSNIIAIDFTSPLATSQKTTTFDNSHPHYLWCIPNAENMMENYTKCQLQQKEVWKEKGVVTSTSITNYTYVFNSDGYPTKVTSIETDTEGYSKTKVYDITYR
jgi:hypothetical protein